MRRFIDRLVAHGAVVLISASALGCAHEVRAPQPPPAPRSVAPPVVTPAAPPEPTLDGPPGLPAHQLATLDHEDEAAQFTWGANGGLALFASQGQWSTRAVTAAGEASPGSAKAIATIPRGVTVSTLRAVGDGYIVAWIEPSGDGQNLSLKLVQLDAAGAPKGDPVLITQSAEELGWVDVLASQNGALLLWEQSQQAGSTLFMAPIGKAGLRSPAQIVAREVLGWEACGTSRGAALALVKNSDAAGESSSPKLGRVELVEVSSDAKPSPAVVVSSEASAQIDPQIVELDGRYLVAWTDEREHEANVFIAGVAPGGALVSPPHRALDPLGEQALVGLIAGQGPAGPQHKALLAWEDLSRSANPRRIHLATVRSDSSLGAERGSLSFHASGPPDLVADGDGFAALTLAPMASKGAAQAGSSIVPSFVRFGSNLSIRASEPLRSTAFLKTLGLPALTRSLACHADRCAALATGAGDNAALALVDLTARQSSWEPPAAEDPPPTPPRAKRTSALQIGDPVADVAAVTSGTGALSAWVTYHNDESRDDDVAGNRNRSSRPEATLAVRPTNADGVPGKPIVLSVHAVSVGGVAMTKALGEKGEAVIAWVGRDQGSAQVFVTKVGPDGQKLAQTMVTLVARKPLRANGTWSEPSDVAIAAASGGEKNDGYTLAWVDTRDGNAEVYAVKLDRNLVKIGQERRITDAPGDAADVAIAVQGPTTLLAWADSRRQPEQGKADIYLARLDSRQLQPLEAEQRVFASTTHSRSPVLAQAATGVALAWIEEGPDDVATAPGAASEGASATPADAGVRLAWLDAEGRVTSAPARVSGAALASSVSLRCDRTCRGVFTAGAGDGLALGAFEAKPGAEPGRPRILMNLTGAAGEDSLLTFASDSSVVFADDTIGGAPRVRFLAIDW